MKLTLRGRAAVDAVARYAAKMLVSRTDGDVSSFEYFIKTAKEELAGERSV